MTELIMSSNLYRILQFDNFIEPFRSTALIPHQDYVQRDDCIAYVFYQQAAAIVFGRKYIDSYTIDSFVEYDEVAGYFYIEQWPTPKLLTDARPRNRVTKQLHWHCLIVVLVRYEVDGDLTYARWVQLHEDGPLEEAGLQRVGVPVTEKYDLSTLDKLY